jgi:hypothetical protein
VRSRIATNKSNPLNIRWIQLHHLPSSVSADRTPKDVLLNHLISLGAMIFAAKAITNATPPTTIQDLIISLPVARLADEIKPIFSAILAPKTSASSHKSA